MTCGEHKIAIVGCAACMQEKCEQIAALEAENARLRDGLRDFLDYFEPRGGVSDVPLGPFERAQELLSVAAPRRRRHWGRSGETEPGPE